MSGQIDVADAIAAFRRTYVASSLGLMVVQHPAREQIVKDCLGLDRGSTVRLGRKDDTYYEGMDVWASLDAVRDSPDYNLEFLTTFFTMGLSTIGHICAAHRYFDNTPELELLRHLRNGASHGNRFNLRKRIDKKTGGIVYEEPSRKASFRGFEVTAAQDGQAVLFDFMMPGDLMDLLDYLENHLRAAAP